ncbi:transcription/translation regulatory transformer protein RfaH [Pseudomonas sp. GD03842]|uniref:transcription/translation regulatory transformer protein RfaH n=1 Tax=unclassified Pseudomonas TaxID=196821 RepID=UPI000D34D4F5|nr:MULTISPECIES: transcription/translation regulatory transformer protein RfaH [unclassified Pseudomonas]MDH0749610.1 transcription/translation regulatory transformer protein RfaH [Pseudomonas sp. GD03842]RAU47610.1 transcription/translation regulatory transformer protein RfaH [Pseudomonas sp. RIT 409]RAU52050.1 transcription/translation regulatory transformer protein RfaH [Pseudomonas sp. RIT 412]
MSHVVSTSNDSARWYLIQTKPRQEARAEEHLQRQNFACYRPVKQGEKKRGARAASEEELFPGYLFIHMDQTQDNWYPIRSTRGVARIVTFGGMPIPVKDELIEQIRQRLLAPVPKVVFQQGEAVRITADGFNDIEAIFLAADGDERAVILLNLLHREQKVTLPVSSLSRLEARVS